ALDLRSKSGIHRLIKALEERGFIRRLPNRARAIDVIRLPDAAQTASAAAPQAPVARPRGFAPSVIEGNLGKARLPESANSNEPIPVPVMGRIAAGVPIDAIQNHTHTIGV